MWSHNRRRVHHGNGSKINLQTSSRMTPRVLLASTTSEPPTKTRTKTIKIEIQRISTKFGVVTLKRKNGNNL